MKSQPQSEASFVPPTLPQTVQRYSLTDTGGWWKRAGAWLQRAQAQPFRRRPKRRQTAGITNPPEWIELGGRPAVSRSARRGNPQLPAPA